MRPPRRRGSASPLSLDAPTAPLAGLALLLLALAGTEVLLATGISPHLISPLILLAIGAASYSGGWLPALVSAALGVGYGLLRIPPFEGDPTALATVGVALLAGVVLPGLMLWLRSASQAGRRRAHVHGRREAWRRARSLRRRQADYIDGLGALVWEMGATSGTGRIVNAYGRRRLGIDAASNHVAFPDDLVHPDDRARFREALAAVLRDGQPHALEYRLLARDGFPVWVQDEISLVANPPGGEPRIRGTGVDITLRKSGEQEILREVERYRDLVEGVPVGLYRMTPQGTFHVVNSAMGRMMGYLSRDEFLAAQDGKFFGEATEQWRWQKGMMQGGGWRSFDLPCRRRDGEVIWVRNTARAAFRPDGEVDYYEGVLEDVTERTRAEAAEQTADDRFRDLVEQSLVGIFLVQEDAVVYANPKVAEIFGYSEGELLSLPSVSHLAIDEHQPKLWEYLAQQIGWGQAPPLVFRGRRGDATAVEVELHCTRTTHDDGPAVHCTILDITSRKKAEDRLFHAAFHDPLTGLPNRILFMERLQHALQRQRRGSRFAVLFLDLIRFKEVNDSLGHAMGDEFLRVVSRRLQSCLRLGDSVARFGGDEFALLLEQIDEVADAEHVADRVLLAMAAPIMLGENEVRAGVSVGIALSSGAYDKPEEIIRNADMAMYRAKTAGVTRYEVFDEAMQSAALERLRLETDLQRAVQREEFFLLYQPIVSLSSGRIEAFEALVRWNHPERGPISPDAFMPVAEELGLSAPIGRQVLRIACTQGSDWRNRFPGAARLAINVNLSPRQIRESAIIDDVRTALFAAGLAPAALNLEITESLIMADRAAAGALLRALKAIGVGVLLDNFGTGYSSLEHLGDLPIDTLKIDRSFVARVHEEGGEHLVRTMINVARNLRMGIVAEGIETESQILRMRELGCESAQGFGFSPPRTASDAERLVVMELFPLPMEQLSSRLAG